MILWLAFHPGWNGHQTRDQVVLLTPIRGGWWSVMVSPGAPTYHHSCHLHCLPAAPVLYNLGAGTCPLSFVTYHMIWNPIFFDLSLSGMFLCWYWFFYIRLELTFERWHEGAKGGSNYCQAEHYPHTFTGDFMCYSAILFHSPRH